MILPMDLNMSNKAQGLDRWNILKLSFPWNKKTPASLTCGSEEAAGPAYGFKTMKFLNRISVPAAVKVLAITPTSPPVNVLSVAWAI